MKDSELLDASVPGHRRVKAVVALRLLEVMRDMDLPIELLGDENPTLTIPRRFGLSDVVERQIRKYREDTQNRVRISDEEVQGLLRFVVRRPDGPQVFYTVGRLLGRVQKGPWLIGHLPKGIQYRVVRRRVRRLLVRLFGRTIVGFAQGHFVIEGRSSLLVQADPGGGACQLLSGLSEEVISRTLGRPITVDHKLCQGRGDDRCRWQAQSIPRSAEVVVPPRQ